MAVLSDGLNTVDFDYVYSTVSGCTVQADAQDGKSFMLDAVRIFLNELRDTTHYTGDNLKLQGFNAQTGQWTDIEKQFEDIHEGWNSLDWKKDEVRPVFNSVRL